MKFENHYKTAIKNETHYIPDGRFILENSEHKFNNKGNLIKLKTKKDIYFILWGRKIVVKKGFEFDGVSTGIAKWFFPKFDMETLPGGLLHDWLYSEFYQTHRHLADTYIDIILEYSGVCFIKRKMFYAAVRMFGWLAWRNNKKKL